jgi:hypothetical protein
MIFYLAHDFQPASIVVMRKLLFSRLYGRRGFSQVGARYAQKVIATTDLQLRFLTGVEIYDASCALAGGNYPLFRACSVIVDNIVLVRAAFQQRTTLW